MNEITTAEELDALPESDVLLLASGTYPRDDTESEAGA